jgi:hypothetical protein
LRRALVLLELAASVEPRTEQEVQPDEVVEEADDDLSALRESASEPEPKQPPDEDEPSSQVQLPLV